MFNRFKKTFKVHKAQSKKSDGNIEFVGTYRPFNDEFTSYAEIGARKRRERPSVLNAFELMPQRKSKEKPKISASVSTPNLHEIVNDEPVVLRHQNQEADLVPRKDESMPNNEILPQNSRPDYSWIMQDDDDDDNDDFADNSDTIESTKHPQTTLYLDNTTDECDVDNFEVHFAEHDGADAISMATVDIADVETDDTVNSQPQRHQQQSGQFSSHAASLFLGLSDNSDNTSIGSSASC